MIPSTRSFSLLLLGSLLLGPVATAQVGPGPVWSTYFGGTGSHHTVQGVRVTGNGDVLVWGATKLAPGSPDDGFVARLDPSATGLAQLVWSINLGGTGNDEIRDLAVAPNGDLVVCGYSASANFPITPGALQPTLAGNSDMFVARISCNQDPSLVWSTYLGTPGREAAEGVVLLANGNIAIAGSTSSLSFPIVGTPRQRFYGGGALDGVLAVVNSTGSTLLASTFHGGMGTDSLVQLALDPSGGLVVAGCTDSANFPLQRPYQRFLRGLQDGFVSCLNASLGGLTYSTYLGGSGSEIATNALAVTVKGCIVFGGFTNSANFPVTNGSSWAGSTDGFISILDPAGTGPTQQLTWSSYFGSSLSDGVWDVAVGPSDLVTVVGVTTGSLPTTVGAFGCTFNGGAGDGFAARFDPYSRTGVELLYATYLGGSGDDRAFALDLDAQGDAVFAGSTDSLNFPVKPGAYQPGFGGGLWDAFVTELPLLPAGVTRYGAATLACGQPLQVGVNAAPLAGTANFALFASGAQPSAWGVVAFGAPPLKPGMVLNAQIWVSPPLVTVLVGSDPYGFAHVRVPLPVTPLPPYGVGVQWLFASSPVCALPLRATEGLRL